MSDYTFADKRELVKLRRFVNNLVLVGLVFLMGSCVKSCAENAMNCQAAVADDDYEGTQKYCID